MHRFRFGNHQVHEGVSQVTSEVQLSLLQGYMASFFRSAPILYFSCFSVVSKVYVCAKLFWILRSGNMERGLLGILVLCCVHRWWLFLYCVLVSSVLRWRHGLRRYHIISIVKSSVGGSFLTKLSFKYRFMNLLYTMCLYT